MTTEVLPAEAFAHYMRGAITLFVALTCWDLYKHRHENRMMRLLFFAMLCMTMCYLKDIVLIYHDMQDNCIIDDLINLTDLLSVPLGTSLFVELSRPGYTTRPTTIGLFLIQAVFLPLYLLFPSDGVMVAAYVAAGVQLLYAATTVVIYTTIYNRFIEKNYSYTENISVRWVGYTFVMFIFLFIGDIGVSTENTWVTEAIYNTLSLVLWILIFHFVIHHRIVVPSRVVEEQRKEEQQAADEPAAADGKDYDYIAKRLSECMEKEQLYLNPKVSIFDVARTVGTNKTYLSGYINGTLGMTFYDYINNYRIEEACTIIDQMSETGRKPMTEVAEMSGFNSLSSFNRYFKKAKGMSAKEYSMKSA